MEAKVGIFVIIRGGTSVKDRQRERRRRYLCLRRVLFANRGLPDMRVYECNNDESWIADRGITQEGQQVARNPPVREKPIGEEGNRGLSW